MFKTKPKTIEEHPAARAAAEWWAAQSGNPVHRIVTDEQRDFKSDFFEIGMLTLAAQNPVPDGAGKVFADALTETISGMLARGAYISIGVDYGPDTELREAALKAGIHPSRFPIKTNCWVRADHVTASLGYQGATKLVWHEPGWVHPACGSQRYTDNYETPLDEVCSLPRYHAEDHGDWQPDAKRCIHCGEGYVFHYGTRDADGTKVYPRHSFETKREG